MKNKTLAKILSLLCLTSLIVSCKTEDDDEQQIQLVEVELKNGIVDWQDFKHTAGTDFENKIDNDYKIKGFKGYALYSELLSFFKSENYFSSSIPAKRYETNGLEIFFDTYQKDENDTATEITPSILNDLYTKITHVNITAENKTNGSFEYIKISSGDKGEVFDINKFYARLSRGEFSIKGITTHNKENEMLLGIDDDYLSDNFVTNMDKINYLLQNNIFKNSLLAKVNLTGNISGIETLYPREKENGNITFMDGSYSKPKTFVRDVLSLADLSERQTRGFKINIENTDIMGNDDKDAEVGTLDLSFATMKNITFKKDASLKDIAFNNVNATGDLIFEGELPAQMKYLNAENIIFQDAKLPYTEEVQGTNITGLKAKTLRSVGTLLNDTAFTSDVNSPKGELDTFIGTKQLYDILKNIIQIQNPDVRVDIVKLMLIKNQKQYG